MDLGEVHHIDTPPDSDEQALQEPGHRADLDLMSIPAPCAQGEDVQSLPKLNTLTNPEEGVTELMQAARSGDVAAVQELMGEQVGQSDARGRTALMYAAEAGKADVVELLREQEAGMQDTYLWTALFYAAQNGHHAVVTLLAPLEAKMQRKDGCTALFLAVFWNHVECVRILAPLEAGIRTNYKHWQGGEYTALMEAARWARLECIELLVDQEHGMKDASGNRAIDYARAPYTHVPADRKKLSIELLEQFEES